MTDAKPERADLEKVIDKVRKLLALGSSPNEHEAALAVSKAQALLEQYDLTMESIEDLKSDKRTSIRRGDHFGQSLGTEGKTDGWKEGLFEAVAFSFDCFTDSGRDVEQTPSGRTRVKKTGRFIGFAHDVEMASYSLSFLIHEIERLAQGYADNLWAEIRNLRDSEGMSQHDAESEYVRRTNRHPLKAKLYFIQGAAGTVADNLRSGYYKRQAESSSNPHAIVLRDKRSAVADFISMERYGRTVAEQEAHSQALWQAWREKNPAPATLAKEETPAQRRKREEANRRYWERHDAKRRREQERRDSKTDHRAYRAGQDAGESIRINPGLNKGQAQKNLG